MQIGYVRVSTAEQNEARQVEALSRHGIEKWFTEKVSTRNQQRPQLQAMIEFAREGDIIYIHDFSRLARSTRELLAIIESLEARNVSLVSNKESIDTATPQGKLMLTMLGAINEFERENMLERQREGIAIAKAQGKYKGRKKVPFPEDWETVYARYKNREITGIKAMTIMGLTRSTFYKLKAEYETGGVK